MRNQCSVVKHLERFACSTPTDTKHQQTFVYILNVIHMYMYYVHISYIVCTKELTYFTLMHTSSLSHLFLLSISKRSTPPESSSLIAVVSEHYSVLTHSSSFRVPTFILSSESGSLEHLNHRLRLSSSVSAVPSTTGPDTAA